MTAARKKPNQEELRRQVYAAQLALRAQEARSGILPFTEFMMPDPNAPDDPLATRYQARMHHRVLAEAIDNVVAGKCLRLIVSMPPQHGKSQLTSRSAPPYILGRFPWKHLMLGTYSQDFAEQFGGDVREIMQSGRYGMVFPGVRLKDGSKSREYMMTEQGGKLSFLGRGGAGTGKPADFFIIDDPIKDAMEAESPTVREAAWQWFTKVVYTRCHVLSAIIITMTRWHEDDIVGRLTDTKNPAYEPEIAKQWTVINLPAILTKADGDLPAALDIELNEQGEAALWPDRFPLEHLHSAKLLNPLGFSALYQGRPTPPEGSFFKRAHFLPYKPHQLPKNLRMYGSADLAVSPDKNADSSVIGNWGLDENDDLWLLPDLYWENKAADETVDQLLAYAKTYQWQTFFGERGVIDRAVGPFLDKKMMEPGNQWFHVETFPAVGTKAMRCVSIRGRMAQQRVHLPTFAPWWSRAEHELLKFTGSGKDLSDDFADMLGMIGQGLGMQFKASKPAAPSNVIQIGTMAWVKAAHDEDQRARKRAAARKGF